MNRIFLNIKMLPHCDWLKEFWTNKDQNTVKRMEV